MNKNTSELFENWNTMRFVALGIGGILATLAYLQWDGLTLLLSLFFLFQAVTNKGCMVSRNCSVNFSKPNNSSAKDFNNLSYQEVKQED